MKLSSIAAGAALFTSSVFAADLDPIIIKGSKFFYKSNDTQFYIRGVAYQQEYTGPKSDTNNYKDPLSDAAACRRDVPYLQQLNANTIRVYAIDPKADHTECMNLLSEAGIYVIADLSSPSESIIRNDPKWDWDLFQRYASVVDELAQYSNVLGFFAGNEVSNNPETTGASAYVKAAVRDMKRYIKAKNYRTMGVGYATNDDSSIRVDMADYFNCGTQEESIDFWGYNVYSWCGDSNYEKSGYKSRTDEFRDYSIPVFFAEYGCNAVQPRKFTEVEALYGDQMADIWSGGIVYMYFQEENNYGLVSIDNGKASTLEDFSYLSKQLASATPTGTKKGSYSPSNTALQSCPTLDKNWEATASPLPPSPNEDLCTCMEKSLTCIAKSDIAGKQLSSTFSTVCGYQGGEFCEGVMGNATTGEYGAYSVCTPEQQLSFAMNQYYEAQEGSPDACDFDGAASSQSTSEPTAVCSSLLNDAGAAGTGTVKASPTAAGAGGSGGSSGGDADTSDGAGFALTPSSVHVGAFQLSAYVATAIFAGAAMILL